MRRGCAAYIREQSLFRRLVSTTVMHYLCTRREARRRKPTPMAPSFMPMTVKE